MKTHHVAMFPMLAMIAMSGVPRTLVAQHGDAAPSLASTAPKDASQLAFLIGQWELAATKGPTTLAMRIHGAPRIVGSWKAWRALDGFGVEDDLRLSDASGNPLLLSHAVRLYDAADKHWKSSTIDVYRAVFTSSIGEWRDGQMVFNSKGTDAGGQAYMARAKFYDITATSFRFQQDRSTDDGKTWTEGVLKIEARRVAAVAPR